jgi:hypothetical protein
VVKLTAADAVTDNRFGHVVVARSGAAHLFKRNGGGADDWGQVEKLIAGDPAAYDYFGHSVSISGNAVVVGAPYDDDEGNDAGSTYVFRWAAAEVYLPLVLSE